ncbi:MAG TPA: hypothetical protein VEQ37_18545 [Actinomycetota bacterium]|nr:hypothetical protein [Actinomycetota bacterium]
MKKGFPIALMIFGLVFLAAGVYTVSRGYDARKQVRSELLAQHITTTPDAAIPNVPVQDAKTAKAMADIIDHHAREATGGKTYAQMGRFLAKDGSDTSDESLAVKDSKGQPVPNPLRNVAFQSTALRTSLYTSVMAFNVADLVIGLGLMIAVLGFAVGGIGVALGGLAIPALARRFHVEPVAARLA